MKECRYYCLKLVLRLPNLLIHSIGILWKVPHQLGAVVLILHNVSLWKATRMFFLSTILRSIYKDIQFSTPFYARQTRVSINGPWDTYARVTIQENFKLTLQLHHLHKVKHLTHVNLATKDRLGCIVGPHGILHNPCGNSWIPRTK